MDISKSDARMLDLPDLLSDVHEGLIALPEFQRDFDWDQKDVLALLVTVLMGWPAGSLLLMDGKAHFFRVRGFDHGPQVRNEFLKYTVLDGQQRLTGLYQAIYDRGPFVYAVAAAALDEGTVEALDEGLRAFKRADWDERLRNLPWSNESQWVPMYVMASASDYFAWRDEVIAGSATAKRDATAARLSDLYRSGLERLHKYKFPAVTVESTLAPSAIARIFERVNRTGIRLSAFDLMVAKLYETDWNLRDLWERARRDSELLDVYLGDDGMPVLQTVALRHMVNIRESAVLELPQPLVRQEWDESVQAMHSAVEFLITRCGVLRPDWIPYRGMLVPLATLARDHDLSAYTSVLLRWFWSRSFGLSFDAAANTRLVAEYTMLARALAEGSDIPIPSASRSALFESSKRRQGPIWRGFMCLLASRGALDLDGGDLGLRAAAEQAEPLGGDILVTPLFPTGVDTGPQSEPAHLRVLNLVLTRRETARRLREEWVSGIVRSAADSQRGIERVLDSQLLPPLATLEDVEEDWRPFFEWRLRALTAWLSQEVGQTVERQEPIADAE